MLVILLLIELLFHPAQRNTFDKVFLEKRINQKNGQDAYGCDRHTDGGAGHLNVHVSGCGSTLPQGVDVFVDVVQNDLNRIILAAAALCQIVHTVLPVVPVAQSCHQADSGDDGQA